MMPMHVDTSANATGHRSTFHTCATDEHRDTQRQENRREAHLPPRPPLVDVVGAIESVDDADHCRRRAPERKQQTEGQHARVVAIAQAGELIAEDLNDVGGREAAQTLKEIAEDVRGQKTGEREHAYNGGHQTEKEVIGQLGGQSEDVVLVDLVIGPLDELRPRKRNLERVQHATERCKPPA
jgi:hypothetical protein